MRTLVASVVVLLVGLSGVASAQDKAEPLTDKGFLIKAIAAGHAEVKYSELADSRSSNDKVKDLARQMIKDHTAANNRLAELAKSQRLAVLAGLERDKRATYNRLKGLKGADFDKAYVDQMVMDHKEAVSLFGRASTSASNGDLKRFATETLPTLRGHLKHSEALQRELRGGARR